MLLVIFLALALTLSANSSTGLTTPNILQNVSKVIKLRCDSPLEVASAKYMPVKDSYFVGDTIFYQCNLGYVNTAEEAIYTCTAVNGQGSWIGNHFQCNIGTHTSR